MAMPKKTQIQNPSSSSKIPFPPRKIWKPLKPKVPNTDSSKPGRENPSKPTVVKPLMFEGEIDAALTHLRSSDPLLTTLIDSCRPPAFESQCPPFLALAKSILYQQLVANAAKSIKRGELRVRGMWRRREREVRLARDGDAQERDGDAMAIRPWVMMGMGPWEAEQEEQLNKGETTKNMNEQKEKWRRWGWVVLSVEEENTRKKIRKRKGKVGRKQEKWDKVMIRMIIFF